MVNVELARLEKVVTLDSDINMQCISHLTKRLETPKEQNRQLNFCQGHPTQFTWSKKEMAEKPQDISTENKLSPSSFFFFFFQTS